MSIHRITVESIVQFVSDAHSTLAEAHASNFMVFIIRFIGARSRSPHTSELNSGISLIYMFRTIWEFVQSQDCVAHSRNPEIAHYSVPHNLEIAHTCYAISRLPA